MTIRTALAVGVWRSPAWQESFPVPRRLRQEWGPAPKRTIRFALICTLLEGAGQIQAQARSLDGSPAAIVSRQLRFDASPRHGPVLPKLS